MSFYKVCSDSRYQDLICYHQDQMRSFLNVSSTQRSRTAVEKKSPVLAVEIKYFYLVSNCCPSVLHKTENWTKLLTVSVCSKYSFHHTLTHGEGVQTLFILQGSPVNQVLQFNL